MQSSSSSSSTNFIKTQVLHKTSEPQWLKCNGMQGNAVPPPPIYGLMHSPTSDCYNARERHTTIVKGPNLNVASHPALILHFNPWLHGVRFLRLRDSCINTIQRLTNASQNYYPVVLINIQTSFQSYSMVVVWRSG